MRFSEEQLEKILLAYFMLDSNCILEAVKRNVNGDTFNFVDEKWKSFNLSNVPAGWLAKRAIKYNNSTNKKPTLQYYHRSIENLKAYYEKEGFDKNLITSVSNYLIEYINGLDILLDDLDLNINDFAWILEDYRSLVYNRIHSQWTAKINLIDKVNKKAEICDSMNRMVVDLKKFIPWSDVEPEKKFSTRNITSYVVDDYKRIMNLPDPCSTGFKIIDNAGGWRSGEISMVVAPSGGGKSVFLQYSGYSAAKDGANVLYISFELTDSDLWQRHLTIETGYHANEFKDKKISVSELKELCHAAEKSLDGNLTYLFVPSNRTPNTIEQAIINYNNENEERLQLVVIDYIDELEGDSQNDAAFHDKIANAFAEIKDIAIRNNVAVLTAQQMNREGMNSTKDNYDPQLSHITGSSRVVNKVHNVFFLLPSKDDYKKKRIIHRKARNKYIEAKDFTFIVYQEGLKYVEMTPEAWDTTPKDKEPDPAEDDGFDATSWQNKKEEEIYLLDDVLDKLNLDF